MDSVSPILSTARPIFGAAPPPPSLSSSSAGLPSDSHPAPPPPSAAHRPPPTHGFAPPLPPPAAQGSQHQGAGAAGAGAGPATAASAAASTGKAGAAAVAPPVKRTGVACTRCRRGKQKCINEGVPPCQACIARGLEDECVLGERGKAMEDRVAPRPPRKRRAEDDLADGGAYVPASTSRRSSLTHAHAHGNGFGNGHGTELSPPTGNSAAFLPPSSAAAALAFGTPPLRGGAGFANGHGHGQGRAVGNGQGRNVYGGGGGYKDELEEDELEEEHERAEEEVLPPLPLLVEACENYFHGYFQLGFLHRPSFLHKLANDPAALSPFLLLSILAISARFTDSLVRRHGGEPGRASEVYAERALKMVLNEITEPSLERVQALYMLGIYDFGNGQAFRSKAFQNLARQMAEILKLQEDDPSLSEVENEVRRRTWWFLTMDANLLNAVGSRVGAFDPLTVPIPLPSQENDFAFGIKSRVPQYFPGATSAIAQEHPPVQGEVSLLGALLGCIAIFGRTARAISTSGPSLPSDPSLSLAPWNPASFFASTSADLAAWADSLSPVQQWGTQTLLAYRTQHLDLGFMCIWADFHAIRILLRRAYLPHLIRALAPEGLSKGAGSRAGSEDGEQPPNGDEYWRAMAHELVESAWGLVELQEEVARVRPTARGITPHLAFCTFLAGTILNYLRVCPWLSPSRAAGAPLKLASTLCTLQHIASLWPIAQRWHRSLYDQIISNPSHSAVFDPDHAAGIAKADLEADQEAGLYRQYAPTPVSVASSPAHQLDAASALAALAQDAHAQQAGLAPAVSAAAAAKRFSTHLRQAGPPTPAAPTNNGLGLSAPSPFAAASPGFSSFFSSSSAPSSAGLTFPGSSATPTPFNLFSPGPASGADDGAAGSGADIDALLKLDLGDLGELNAFLVGYGGGGQPGGAAPMGGVGPFGAFGF
ncbi:hypothetical protein JCM10207_006107 [Rhodosporidiobolus poonsookiae]